MPVIALPVALLALGMSWTIGAFGVFLRDLSQLTNFLTLALMYASAVFYSTQRIPHSIWQILRFNPLLLAVTEVRNAVLWNQPVNLMHVGYLYVVGFAACYFGHLIFRRLKPAFADVL